MEGGVALLGFFSTETVFQIEFEFFAVCTASMSLSYCTQHVSVVSQEVYLCVLVFIVLHHVFISC